MSDELKPCPCCGGEPTLSEIAPHSHMLSIGGVKMPDYPGSWTIECCAVGLINESREAVIAAWNRRPPAVSAEPSPIERALRDAVTRGAGMVRVHSDSSIDYIPESAWRATPPTSEQARDAERYKFMRDVLRFEDDRWIEVAKWNHDKITQVQFDEAVDAAMKSGQADAGKGNEG